MRRVRLPATGVLLAVLVLGACTRGGDEPGSGPVTSGGASCGPDVEEPLDPRSTHHLLPGAPEPAYGGDPPTSGPHRSDGALAGVHPEPLPRPLQGGLLARGGVLVQHRLPRGPEREALEALADDMVVVAPLAGQGPSVVATAWRHRMACTGADLDALRAFVSAHRGRVGA